MNSVTNAYETLARRQDMIALQFDEIFFALDRPTAAARGLQLREQRR